MAFILLFAERADDARVARLTLEHAGHEVLSFSDPQALQAAVPEVHPQPRLIVCDALPRPDQPSVWVRIRQVHGWGVIPVLLLAEGPADEGTAAGVDDVLAKPYALKDLVYRAGRLLARQPEPV